MPSIVFLVREGGMTFFQIYIWPLIGCSIGAGAVYWFGPMLIVFGMFVVGTASVALREMVLEIKKKINGEKVVILTDFLQTLNKFLTTFVLGNGKLDID